jgi:hypothetical protein
MVGICWGVLNGPGELAAINYEKDGTMVANGWSWIERNGERFARLLEEANGSLGAICGGAEKKGGFWCVRKERRRKADGEEEKNVQKEVLELILEVRGKKQRSLEDIAIRSSV